MKTTALFSAVFLLSTGALFGQVQPVGYSSECGGTCTEGCQIYQPCDWSHCGAGGCNGYAGQCHGGNCYGSNGCQSGHNLGWGLCYDANSNCPMGLCCNGPNCLTGGMYPFGVPFGSCPFGNAGYCHQCNGCKSQSCLARCCATKAFPDAGWAPPV
ncbi:MAG: hypothetical protein KDA85_17485, partial [Planctomycetaceae bacterium]|nr:hypothetical protein [Planctomycetaceae bacterium]